MNLGSKVIITKKFRTWVIACSLLSTLCSPLHAQIAQDKCKFLGNVIAGSVPSDYATYWNQVTPENSGKWESVEGEKDNMNWNGLDLAYDYAKDKGFPFKQHTFVWGNQAPAWIGTLQPEEQKHEVEEWIKAYCERYPETDFIDVVNEPLHAKPTFAQALGGNGTTGWDWVIWSFQKAREYCPNAKLLLNDYSIINDNNQTNIYIGIINLLKERGLIDGIGEQGHFFETTPLNTLKSNLTKLAGTGLPIYISEYDVNLSDDEDQQAKLEEQFTLFWTNPAVRGITLWGYKEGAIWRTDAYLLKSNGVKRPALNWLSSFVPNAPGGNFCYPVTAVEDTDFSLEIYPNPAIDGKVSLQMANGKYEISVVNLYGNVLKKISTQGGENVSIELPDSPGVYVLQIFNGVHTRFNKVIRN